MLVIVDFIWDQQSELDADIPADPALESSPETEAVPAFPSIFSEPCDKESNHPVSRSRTLRDSPVERQDSGEGSLLTPVPRPRRQAAIKFKDKFDSWRRDDLVWPFVHSCIYVNS